MTDQVYEAFRRDTEGLRRAYECACIEMLRATARAIEMHVEIEGRYDEKAVAYFKREIMDFLTNLLLTRPWEREWERDWERGSGA